MKNYLTNTLTVEPVPQTSPLPGKTQVKNSAGGFVFAVDNFTKLNRFLVLGTEGGSYYASEKDLTKSNVDGLKAALAEDPVRFVNEVVAISDAGRAPKNDPALFALALAAADKRPDVSAHALANLSKVARIPTHLFHFVEYVQAMRGWGRGLRAGIANWYLDKPADKLAYQMAKYQSRDGWSHRDLLRLSHAHPKSSDHQALLHWAVKGWDSVGVTPHENKSLLPIWAFERAKRLDAAKDSKEMVRLIGEYNLPRECVPTEFLNDVAVWAALLEKMPVTAMIRNLGKMTSIGLIGPNSDASKLVCKALADVEMLKRGRVHPVTVLMAHSTYKNGQGLKGSLTWKPVQAINSALQTAFYDSFAAVPCTGKNFYLGLDVSASMTWSKITGTNITPREGSAVMAMVTARVEQSSHVAGFHSSMVDIPIDASMSLAEAITVIERTPAGSTDCSLPMIDALQRKIPVDAFVVYTDNETYAGRKHPVVALQEYRNKMGIDAKLIVVGMQSNNFTIADPTDAGMLDVVGFDSATPQIIGEFAGGGGITVTEDDVE